MLKSFLITFMYILSACWTIYSQPKHYIGVSHNLDNSVILDSANIRITYSLEFVEDSLNLEKKWKDLKILLIGNKVQNFYSYFGRQIDSAFTTNIKGTKAFKQLPLSEGVFSERYDIYYNFPEGKQTVVENITRLRSYLYKESFTLPEWFITGDTTTLLNFHCHKAVCRFYGRTWEVWFAPEIALNAGPWKLRGLPGLILKASDERNHYVFECTGIEKLKQPEPIIIIEKAYVAASNSAHAGSREKFLKELRELHDNYVNILLSMGYYVMIVDKSGKIVETIEPTNTKFKDRNISYPVKIEVEERYKKIPYNYIELE